MTIMLRQTNTSGRGLDWWTVAIYLLLVLMGWLNIYAAVFDEQNASIFDISQRYGKQLIWIVTAFVLAIVVYLLDTRFYSSFAYPIYLVALLFLIAVLLVGKEINGSKSWLMIGSFQLQPSEFAKIATGLALAKYLGNSNEPFMHMRSVLTIVTILILPLSLILLQPDWGSCLVFTAFLLVLYREGLPKMILLFCALAVVIFIVSRSMAELSYLVGGLVLLGFAAYAIQSRRFKTSLKGLGLYVAVAAALWFMNLLNNNPFELYIVLIVAAVPVILFFLAYTYMYRLPFVRTIVVFILCALVFTVSVDFVFDNILKPHQRERILVVLGLKSDPQGIEYNVIQSKIAIGSGGWTGKGFLQGTQTKYDFVPEQSTDFIFCTVGEEWGFIGAFAVIAAYVVLLLRLLLLAERQRSGFSRVYSYCVVCILLLHFVINIGMTVGLMPVIGIPLPFFSYGGSSLWAFTILLFIMLRLDASRTEYIR